MTLSREPMPRHLICDAHKWIHQIPTALVFRESDWFREGLKLGGELVLEPLTQFHITFVLTPRPSKCRRPVPKLSAPCMNIHGSPSRTNHGIVSSTFLQGERERNTL